METNMDDIKSPDEEKAYRNKVMGERMEHAEVVTSQVINVMKRVMEKIDYQSMTNSEFTTFENNYVGLINNILLEVPKFTRENGVTVTYEELEKYNKETK